MRPGFTFLEITIVLLIMAVMAAVAIPNIIEMRTTSNEAGAASNLQSLVMPALALYHDKGYGDDRQGSYPCHVAALAGVPMLYKFNGFASVTTALSGVAALPASFANLNGPAGSNVQCFRQSGNADFGIITNSGAVVEGYVYATVVDTAVTDNGALNRRRFVTVIAAPMPHPDGTPDTGNGRRTFALCMNPHYYKSMWSGILTQRINELMLDATDAPTFGMFRRPAGYPENDVSGVVWGPNEVLGIARHGQ